MIRTLVASDFDNEEAMTSKFDTATFDPVESNSDDEDASSSSPDDGESDQANDGHELDERRSLGYDQTSEKRQEDDQQFDESMKQADTKKLSSSESESSVYRIQSLDTLKGDKPYCCDICQASFVEKRSVYRHISVVHKKTVEVVGPDGVVVTTMVNGKSVPHTNGHGNISIPLVRNRNETVSKAPLVKPIEPKTNGNNKRTKEVVQTNGKRVSFSEKNSYQPIAAKTDKKSFGYCVPYRCLFEDCASQFPDKESMVNHMMEAHQRILMLEKVSTAVMDKQPPPPQHYTSDASTEDPESPEKMTSKYPKLEKPFVCPHVGCFSSYTRSTRLKEHIRKHHSLDQSLNTSGSSSSSNGSILKVKLSLPKSLPLSSLFSSSPNSTLSPSKPTNRDTIHPKKYPCDFPGCGKVYTKSSHVKRHKDSFHTLNLEPICQITEDDHGEDCPIISNEVNEEPNEDNHQPIEITKSKKAKTDSFVPTCDVCGRTFTRKSDLSRHFNVKHSG